MHAERAWKECPDLGLVLFLDVGGRWAGVYCMARKSVALHGVTKVVAMYL